MDTRDNEQSGTANVPDTSTPAPEKAAAHESRGYFIAPDSAEPWPDAVWDRVDPAAVVEAVERLAAREAPLRAAQRAQLAGQGGFAVSEKQRALLRSIGGQASMRALRRLSAP